MLPDNERGRPAKATPTVSTAISTETSLSLPVDDRADLDTMSSVDLADVVPVGGRLKGLVSYRPAAKTKAMVEHVLELYARLGVIANRLDGGDVR